MKTLFKFIMFFGAVFNFYSAISSISAPKSNLELFFAVIHLGIGIFLVVLFTLSLMKKHETI